MSYGHGGPNAGGPRSMPSSFGVYDPQRAKLGNDPAATWGIVDDSSDDNGSRPGIQKAYDNLKGFFGEVRPGRADLFKGMSGPEVENADYPEAFQMLWGGMQEGVMERNGHIEKLMIEKTVKSDVFWIQKLAPWRYTDKQYITWNATIFNRTSLDRLPEEAVPRLMSQRRTGGATSLMRYGIAMLLEATFAETAIGRRTYLMNLEQMRVATTDTAAYGVLITLMEHEPYTDHLERHQTGNARSDLSSIDERLLAEIDGFGIMQKQEGGGDIVRARMRKRLKDRGVADPNVTLWPSGTSAYFGMTKSEEMHNEESMSFATGSDEGLHDPLFRHRTIGAFATLDDRSVREMPIADYRTCYMDTVAYDGLADKYFLAKYSVNHRYAGVWNYNAPNAPLTEKIGGATMRDLACFTFGQIYRKCARGSFARAVEKTYLAGLSDYDKRSEFLSTMLLHKATDPRVQLEGRPFPDEKTFSEKMLNEPRHFSHDKWAQRPLTVGDHQRADDAKSSQSLRSINERAEYEARLRTTKRKLGLDEDYAPRGAKETFDGTHDADDTTMDIPARTVFLPNGDVAHVPASKAVVRPVRQRLGATGVQEATPYGGLDLYSLVEGINKLSDGLTTTLAAHKDYISTDVLQLATSTIRDSVDTTDEQKITLLNEFRRVVDGVLYDAQWTARDGRVNTARIAFAADPAQEPAYIAALKTADAEKPTPVDSGKALSAIVAAFAPFAARMQLRFAVDSVQEERTALEDRVAAAGSNLYQSIPVDVAEASAWWKPDGTSEDGQVRLMVFKKGETLPLPHDAFAATLTAHHNVLFGMSAQESDALVDAFRPVLNTTGVKRSRVDALVWSIAISALATDPTNAPRRAGDLVAALETAYKQPTKAAIDAANDKAKKAQDALALFTAGLKSGLKDPELTQQVNRLAALQTAANTESAAVEALRQQQEEAALAAADKVTLVRLQRMATSFAERPMLLSQLFLTPFMDALCRTLATALRVPVPAKDPKDPSDADNLTRSMPVRPLASKGYVSPVKLNLGALLLSAKASSSKAAPLVTTPANAEQPSAWSKAFVADCFNRASVHDGRLYAWCVDNDVPVPFCLRMWRPNKCFNMGSALMMKAGRYGAAATYYQVSAKTRVREIEMGTNRTNES